ncbi:MAG: TIM barrel protein [Chloroflexi bacterium]|nr:TIM barrel protein [Chloroflexota bacterium]
MLFTELPFVERIARAAEIGYDAVEFWNWDDKDLPAIRRAAQQAGIEVLTFQSNRGGTLIHPGQREVFVQGIRESLARAQEMDVHSLFLLSDELGPDRSVRYRFPELSEEVKRHSVLDGLRRLAPLAEAAGVTLNLEALNTEVDHAGYWLDRSRVGFELVRQVDSPAIRLLFDLYHMQIMEGNLTVHLLENLPYVGHVHVADVPGRHEPGTGEIHFKTIFRALERAGYDRYVGMEFSPTIDAAQAARQALALVKG